MFEPTPATDAYWAGFVGATSATGEPTIVAFGDSPEMITDLLKLVIEGRKRATAELVREFERLGEALPAVGDHWIVVDSDGAPACICRTIEVRVGPVSSVNDDFAWDEGEGDRTRADWLEMHHRYFRRRADRQGWVYSDEEACVFERFAVVWPPELADPVVPGRFDLSERFVHLGPAGRASEVMVGPEFWATIGDRSDLTSGRLVMVSTSEADWPHWERHPAGEELVLVLDGRVDLVLELPDGDHAVELEAGHGVLVPPGMWHRAIVHEPAQILSITPGRGTEHRPRE